MNIDDENVEVIKDISMLDKYINSAEENFVIGGATIYKLLMPYCKRMYITEINQSFDADVFFPEVKSSEWRVTAREDGPESSEIPFKYEYVTYERI